MESIIVACITGVVTLVGVILSNSKSRAVMEVKLDALTAKVEKLEAGPGAHLCAGAGHGRGEARHRGDQGEGGMT